MLHPIPLLLLAWASCRDGWSARLLPAAGGRAVVEVRDSQGTFRHRIQWPIWNFRRGDADGDGCDELVLGVVKRNRFDSVSRRRIQVWKIDRGRMRPGWLGTRLSGELDTFSLVGPGSLLVRERSGHRWSLARWSWNGFGFRRDSLLASVSRKPPFPSPGESP